METRTYQQIWRQLNPEQKRELSQNVDSTYESLKCVAHRKGRCGKRLARDIVTELVAMEVTTGDTEELLPVIFPTVVMQNQHKGAA